MPPRHIHIVRSTLPLAFESAERLAVQASPLDSWRSFLQRASFGRGKRPDCRSQKETQERTVLEMERWQEEGNSTGKGVSVGILSDSNQHNQHPRELQRNIQK